MSIAGWQPVHGEQLRTQHLVSSMGFLYINVEIYWKFSVLFYELLFAVVDCRQVLVPCSLHHKVALLTLSKNSSHMVLLLTYPAMWVSLNQYYRHIQYAVFHKKTYTRIIGYKLRNSCRSSSHQLLQKPTTRTHFADRAFRCTAPTVWRSLNGYTVDSGSLAVFKSRLKTFLFRRTFHPV